MTLEETDVTRNTLIQLLRIALIITMVSAYSGANALVLDDLQEKVRQHQSEIDSYLRFSADTDEAVFEKQRIAFQTFKATSQEIVALLRSASTPPEKKFELNRLSEEFNDQVLRGLNAKALREGFFVDKWIYLFSFPQAIELLVYSRVGDSVEFFRAVCLKAVSREGYKNPEIFNMARSCSNPHAANAFVCLLSERFVNLPKFDAATKVQNSIQESQFLELSKNGTRSNKPYEDVVRP